MTKYMNRPVDIAILASDAVIELDEMLGGETPSMESVRELVRVLPDFLKASAIDAPGQLDTAAVLVVSQAVNEADWASITTTSQLFEEARKLTSQLAQLAEMKSASDTERIQHFRGFCLALARTATSYGHSFEDLDPSHQCNF